MKKKKEKSVNLALDPNIRVGILHNNFLHGIVRSDVPGRFDDVFIDVKNLGDAKFGTRVVCKITEDLSQEEVVSSKYFKDEFTGKGMPHGEIIATLGDPKSNEATMAGIMAAHNISSSFPGDVLEEVEKFEANLNQDEIDFELNRGRKDISDTVIVTIDGEDTKDIDDGLSVEEKDGITYLGVHIADVTHYVKENSFLDKEAAIRGCSVYMADRVIPMLPKVLSNNLCSLNPNKKRFALSARLGYDQNTKIVSVEVFESLIESKKRLTYNQVYNLLSKDGKADESIKEYKPMLEKIHSLSQRLRQQRFDRGAIDFDFDETKLKLDENGNVLDIMPAESTFANQMIEECMVACNEAIAKKYSKLDAPFIYRAHQRPDMEKIKLFGKVARLLGEKFKLSEKPSSKEIQALVEDIKGKPFKDTLMQLLLRSMAKAQYSDECNGHFGLALDYYCHFTSPIRRYPDLFIHRVIKKYINEETIKPSLKKKAKSYSISNTDSEINSTIAERESVDFKVAEYMKQHVGESFVGKVVGLLDFGIFVKLPNTVEGMAPFRVLNNFYTYYEEDMTVRSKSGKKIIRIGDNVRIKVADADLIARRIEFLLDEKYGTQNNDHKDKKPKNKSFDHFKNKGKKKGKKKNRR